jgi:hypothetical protein
VAVLIAAVAGAADPSLQVEVSERAVSVGDRVPVRVKGAGAGDWLWGELAVEVPELGPWAVVDPPHAIAGAQPPAWELVLAAMAVGDQPLPTMTVTVRPPDGEPRVVTPTEMPVVTIASVLPPDQEVEPAPLRDPVGARGFPWEWLVPAVLALAPVMAVLVWWLRRRRAGAVDDPARRLPPIDQLEALLEELAARVGRDPAEGVCDQLASSVRCYLERRSGEPAQEMTSFELRGLARSSRWPDPVQRSLQRVMTVADGVRFARVRVADADLRHAIDEARAAGHGLEGHLAERQQSAEGSL